MSLPKAPKLPQETKVHFHKYGCGVDFVLNGGVLYEAQVVVCRFHEPAIWAGEQNAGSDLFDIVSPWWDSAGRGVYAFIAIAIGELPKIEKEINALCGGFGADSLHAATRQAIAWCRIWQDASALDGKRGERAYARQLRAQERLERLNALATRAEYVFHYCKDVPPEI